MITILTAYTPGTIYEEIATENRRRCEAFGYRFVAHELQDSDDLHGPVPGCLFKPRLVMDELLTLATGGNGQLIWMDADAVAIRPLDDAMGDSDGFVTIRNAEDVGKFTAATSFLNSGVVGTRGTQRGSSFAACWLREAKRVGGDQRGLNCVFYRDDWNLHEAANYWRAAALYGEAKNIRILPCATYNCLTPHAPPPGCRVLHFRHGILDTTPEGWWRQKIDEALAA